MLATCPVHLTLLDLKVFPQSVLHTLPHSKQSLIQNLHFICSQRSCSINTHPYLFTLILINFSYAVSTLISSLFKLFILKQAIYSPTTACGLETGHTVDCASWSWLECWEIVNCKWGWCGQTEAWQASLLLSLLLYSAYSLDQGMPGK
jgi:hypothetical protein